MAQVVRDSALSLAAQLELARAARAASRVRSRAPEKFPQTERRDALATRKAFRECVAILLQERV
jgi:hypothetical protein